MPNPTASNNLFTLWFVCHPDGQELGLIAPHFNTEAEAVAKRDLWNVEFPGHFVMCITEPPCT